jgi:endonuclease YncB( thermonuclease family)
MTAYALLRMLVLRAARAGRRRHDTLAALRLDHSLWFWLALAASTLITAAVTGLNRSGDVARSPCAVSRVVDADTLRLDCGPGRHDLRVRLACIDAPELAQAPWGQLATEHLRQLVGRRVELISLGTDRWHRVVGRLIDAGGEDINLRMVTDGWAAVYPRYCTDRAYYRAQATARERAIGIWMSDGPHQRPWETR